MPPPMGHVQPQPAPLPHSKHVIAAASGKGGVGKSTVAVNLALALSRQGHAVGLIDADIYGPSLPTMMGVAPDDWPHTPEPLTKYGVKFMSMGLLIDADQAAVLRGPMIHKYLSAFLSQFEWGQLDYLIVDMPPGTGDAALSLSQLVPVSGAVVVTTPQDVSRAVVRRGLAMFRSVRVPVLGIVENMSYFVGDDGKRYEIFGKGGGRRSAEEFGVPLLAAIPMDPQVARQGDAGVPIVHSHPDSLVAKTDLELATAVKARIDELAAEQKTLPSLQL